MGFKTFNSGDILTASDVNSYLMKQVNIVCTSGTRPSSPVEGMTIYETDTDHIVTYDGSSWGRVGHFTNSGRTGVRLVRGANQSIPNTTITSISWDTESLDSDGFIAVTSPTITIPTGLSGTYSITTVLTYAAGAGNGHYIQVLTGGVTYRIPGVDADSLQTWTGVIALAAGDTVVVQTAQFSGGNLNLTGRLEMFRLCP